MSDNLNEMNEHAKYVYWYMSKGHKKDLGVNVKIYQNIIRCLLWFLVFLLEGILLLSFVGWIFMPWINDLIERMPESYENRLVKNGIIYNKDLAINKLAKDKGYSTWENQDKWIVKQEKNIPIHLSIAGSFDLITKSSDDFYNSTSYSDLGINKENIKELSNYFKENIGSRHKLDIALTKYDISSDTQYVKFIYEQVNPKYWNTCYGKKLLEMRPYLLPLESEEYFNRDKDVWNNIGVGFLILGHYKSQFTVTVYA